MECFGFSGLFSVCFPHQFPVLEPAFHFHGHPGHVEPRVAWSSGSVPFPQSAVLRVHPCGSMYLCFIPLHQNMKSPLLETLPFTDPSSAGGRLSFLANMNNAVVNTWLPTFMWTLVSISLGNHSFSVAFGRPPSLWPAEAVLFYMPLPATGEGAGSPPSSQMHATSL